VGRRGARVRTGRAPSPLPEHQPLLPAPTPTPIPPKGRCACSPTCASLTSTVATSRGPSRHGAPRAPPAGRARARARACGRGCQCRGPWPWGMQASCQPGAPSNPRPRRPSRQDQGLPPQAGGAGPLVQPGAWGEELGVEKGGWWAAGCLGWRGQHESSRPGCPAPWLLLRRRRPLWHAPPRPQMTGTLPVELTTLPILSEFKVEYNRWEAAAAFAQLLGWGARGRVGDQGRESPSPGSRWRTTGGRPAGPRCWALTPQGRRTSPHQQARQAA
jgi:hypothetical protein